jgi:hypothetical protein
LRLSLSHGLVATALLFTPPSVAEAQQEATDMRLRSAGFKVRPATTPEEIAHLRRVPPRTILSRTKDGKRTYVYADPDYCKCIFFGDENALRAYKDMVASAGQQPRAYADGRPSTEDMLIGEMNRDLDSPYGPSIFDNPYFD